MPSFTHTKVDPNRLRIIASNISADINQVVNAMAKVNQALSNGGGGSLRATWTGTTSNQFYTQYNVDKEFFDSFLQVLRTLNNQLNEAARIYDTADARAQELVNQLRIG